MMSSNGPYEVAGGSKTLAAGATNYLIVDWYICILLRPIRLC